MTFSEGITFPGIYRHPPQSSSCEKIFSEQQVIITHKLIEEVSTGRKQCWGAGPGPQYPDADENRSFLGVEDTTKFLK